MTTVEVLFCDMAPRLPTPPEFRDSRKNPRLDIFLFLGSDR
jgi:hypothetical protein